MAAKQMNCVQHASGNRLRTLMILLQTLRVRSDQAENIFRDSRVSDVWV